MLSTIIKSALNLVVKLGSLVTAEIKPSATHRLRAAEKMHMQSPPENIEDIPVQLREIFSRATPFPDQLIYEFKNVTVSWDGAILNAFHVFVPSLAFYTYEKEYSGIFLLRQWLAKKIKLTKTVGLVYDNWAVANYYHWLIDTLPRLLLLKKEYLDCTLLIPDSAPDYMVLTAAALGFNRTVALKKGGFARVEHLVMPSHITHPGYQEPALIQAVRSKLVHAFSYSKNGSYPKSVRRIYASRSRQKIRRLLNEEEVIPLLMRYGFEVAYFEEMSFEKQLETMHSAEIIIGVHGANLTNILFMKSGSQIIELLNEETPNPCYFQLASNLELRYQAIPCSPSPSSEAVNNHDITVDVKLLENLLAHL